MDKKRLRIVYVPPQTEVCVAEPYSLLANTFFGGGHGSGSNDDGGGGHGSGSSDDGGGGAGIGSGENNDLGGGLGSKAYFGADDWGNLWEE